MNTEYGPDAIAIIGAACNFPGAPDLDAYTRLIREGADAIRTFGRDELLARGLSEDYVDNPRLVARGGTIDDIEQFDAAFFGFSPGEAELIDPQLRKVLQCAYLSLEDAGMTKEIEGRKTGVVASIGKSSYFLHNLLRSPEFIAKYGLDQVMIYNDRAFVATTLSHRFGLTGPSYTVDTACSSTLSAAHLAMQMLLSYEADVVIAGGAAIHDTVSNGYECGQGALVSPDGGCRPFSEGANGTVPGCGVGFVTLRRAADAIADGDHIHAIILGSAANNDGRRKTSFTAPSVEGQAEVIAMAQRIANVDPASVTYIEAHGTGTKLGDPIEVHALRQTYDTAPRAKPCLLSAVKSNIGHLTTASGIAGLIKAAVCLRDRVLPGTLHCETLNPYLNLDETRFYVLDESLSWEAQDARRAAVSSFGVGGTNVHMLLEEPPRSPPRVEAARPELLVWSARSKASVEAFGDSLVDFVTLGVDQGDLAYTLATQREHLPHRRFGVLHESLVDFHVPHGHHADAARRPSIVFGFPGQGSQYPGMARALLERDPHFRREFESCARLASKHEALDLHALLQEPDASVLASTAVAQPLLFAVEYALARSLMALGIEPDLMIGHSLGDFVAACLAGLFSVDDAMRLVCTRGRIMQGAPAGAMLAVAASAAQLEPLLSAQTELSAINGPSSVTVSGTEDAVLALAELCTKQGLAARKLDVSHGYHCFLMDTVTEAFAASLKTVTFGEPSASLLDGERKRDPAFWVEHLRGCVHFDRDLAALDDLPNSVFVEVGPGATLSNFVRARGSTTTTMISMPRAREAQKAEATFLSLLGALWQRGIPVALDRLWEGREVRKCRTPPYAFDEKRFWIESTSAELRFDHASSAPPVATEASDASDCLYAPQWCSVPPAATFAAPASDEERWCVLSSDAALGEQAAASLRSAGCSSATVLVHGTRHVAADGQALGVDFDDAAAMKALWSSLRDPPSHVLFVDAPQAANDTLGAVPALSRTRRAAHVFAACPDAVAEVVVVTMEGIRVLGDERPGNTGDGLTALVLTLPKECEASSMRLDLGRADCDRFFEDPLSVVREARRSRQAHGNIFALRHGRLWARSFSKINAERSAAESPRDKIFAVTGGMGGIGLSYARHVLEQGAAHVVLLGRNVPSSAHEVEALKAWPDRVHLYCTDVSELDALRESIDAIEQRVGPIDHVVHAAGIAGGRLLRFIDDTSIDPVFAGKVQGALNLIEVFRGRALKSMVLCSSLLSAIGGPGQFAYVAANEALNSMASLADESFRLVSVAWDTWGEVGMAIDALARHGVEDELPTFAIAPSLGVKLMDIALSSDAPLVYASRRDVGALALESLRRSGDRGDHQALVDAVSSRSAARGQVVERAPGDEFIAPQDELQTLLCERWQHYLGYAQISIDDGFFDLGGHSLIAVNIINDVNAEYGLDLGIDALFDSPTVRGLSDHVLTHLLEREETA